MLRQVAGRPALGLHRAQGVQQSAGWLAFTCCCLPYLRLIELQLLNIALL